MEINPWVRERRFQILIIYFSYRVWRDAHPQHAPVVQPHLSAAWHQQVAQLEDQNGQTGFVEASFSEPSTSEEPSTLTN